MKTLITCVKSATCFFMVAGPHFAVGAIGTAIARFNCCHN